MHRILFLPDIQPAGYPVILKAGYRISGRISGKGRMPDIRPDT
jgi:translation initiation factor IF-1